MQAVKPGDSKEWIKDILVGRLYNISEMEDSVFLITDKSEDEVAIRAGEDCKKYDEKKLGKWIGCTILNYDEIKKMGVILDSQEVSWQEG